MSLSGVIGYAKISTFVFFWISFFLLMLISYPLYKLYDIPRYLLIIFSSLILIIVSYIYYWCSRTIYLSKTIGVISPKSLPYSALLTTSYNNDFDISLVGSSNPIILAVEDFWTGKLKPSEFNSNPDFVYLAATKFIGLIEREVFSSLYSNIKTVKLSANSSLFVEGTDSDDGMYIVVEGILNIMKGNTIISHVHSGESIGGFSLITKGKRPFSVYNANNNAVLLKVEREVYSFFAAKYPSVVISFIQNTLARQWRIAYFIMHKFIDSSGNESFDFKSCRCSNNLLDDIREDCSSQTTSQILNLVDNQILFHANKSFGDKLFVILEGKLLGYVGIPNTDNYSIINEFQKGDVLCGPELLAGMSATQSVRSIGPSVIAVIYKSQIYSSKKEFILSLIHHIVFGMESIVNTFYELGMQIMSARAGKRAFKATDPSSINIVVHGRLRIYSKEMPKIIEISAGECFGETELLNNEKIQGYTAIAVRDTEYIQISSNAFSVIQRKFPGFVLQISKIMAKRLNDSTLKRNLNKIEMLSSSSFYFSGKIKTLCFFPASDKVNVKAFCDDMCNELILLELGSCLVVDNNLINSVFGYDITNKMTEYYYRFLFSNWLAEKENEYRFIILSCSCDESFYTLHCVTHADVIFIVANAHEEPSPNTFEHDLFWEENSKRKVLADCSLLLLHSSDLFSTNTSRFLKPRKVRNHFHIRENKLEDVARLARVIGMVAIGLVFSGGGARGLSHYGVIKALEELHIPIDFIGGTSQGALIAALYSKHCSHAAMANGMESLKQMGSIWGFLKAATFPIMSYFSCRHFNRLLKDIFGENTEIEDLIIPFFCVTTNITDSDICVHSSGILWKAVRASMSILDYFPPFLMDGKVLIDGGYINNNPVDIIQQYYAPALTIGVDVELKDDLPFQNVTDWGDDLDGFWLLWKRIIHFLNPFSTRLRIPRFAQILQALSYINNNRDVRKKKNEGFFDIYIRPNITEIRLLDYDRLDHIAEIGYREARARITEWRINNIAPNSIFVCDRFSFKETEIDSKINYDLLRSRSPGLENSYNEKYKFSFHDEGIPLKDSYNKSILTNTFPILGKGTVNYPMISKDDSELLKSRFC